MKLILTNRIFSKLLRVAVALAWALLAATVLGAAPQSAATKATAPPSRAPSSSTLPSRLPTRSSMRQQSLMWILSTRFSVPMERTFTLPGNTRKTGSVLSTLLPKLMKKKVFLWIQKRGTGHSSSWATRLPFPVPLVKLNEKWHFEAKAGSQELFYRRIGGNELDAIDICHGYVEAQYEYAYQPREGYTVNQFAQRITSTPGKQDGLAWQNTDGTWGGPVGEKIARAIEQGYSPTAQPYHGYFYKILKGQGPAAPLGEMNYVVEGAMIGGFALVAAPAEYGVTGLKTFIVSNDGIVYQKDFGPATLNEFIKMEFFNPDQSWTPVPEVPEEEGKDLVEDRQQTVAAEGNYVRRTSSNVPIRIGIEKSSYHAI